MSIVLGNGGQSPGGSGSAALLGGGTEASLQAGPGSVVLPGRASLVGQGSDAQVDLRPAAPAGESVVNAGGRDAASVTPPVTGRAAVAGPATQRVSDQASMPASEMAKASPEGPVRVAGAAQSGSGPREGGVQVRQGPQEGTGQTTRQGRPDAEAPSDGNPATERSASAPTAEPAAGSPRSGLQAATAPRMEAPAASGGQGRPVAARPAQRTSSGAETQNAHWSPGLSQTYAGEAAGGSPSARRAAPELTQRVRGAVIRGSQLARRDGSSELTLRLHPPELGRLKVQVGMRDGELTVRIKAENPEVRAALQDQLPALNRAFRAAQVDVARMEVSNYDSGASGEWQGGPAPHERAPRGSQVYEQYLQSETEPPDGWAHFTESGGVDCLI